MLDRPQELHAVALFLEGIVRGGSAFHGNLRGFQLQRLLGVGSQSYHAGDDQSRAHILGGNILVMIQRPGFHDDLEVPEAGTVVQFDEAKALQVADGAYPAAHRDSLPGQRLAVGKNGCDLCITHHSIRPLHCRYDNGVFYSIFPPFTRGNWRCSCKTAAFLQRMGKLYLNFQPVSDIISKVNAGVMELVDVTDSKSVGSDTVWVRVPPPAPRRSKLHIACSDFFYKKVRVRSFRCSSFSIRKRCAGLRVEGTGVSGWVHLFHQYKAKRTATR